MDYLALNGAVEMAVRERVMAILSEIGSVQAALFQARNDAITMQRQRDELAQKVLNFEDWKRSSNDIK